MTPLKATWTLLFNYPNSNPLVSEKQQITMIKKQLFEVRLPGSNPGSTTYWLYNLKRITKVSVP